MWKLWTHLTHETSRKTSGDNSSIETMGTLVRELSKLAHHICFV